ncbi:MAG: 5-formyltetrahydrofolate cyclo-ligase [Rhizobiaceae bacterium]|nr:5-formyltetrahydrofolate cyclo-ligase [Rhizobiaceae bacterium]
MQKQEEKAALRKDALARRDALAIDRRIEMSLVAADHGVENIEFDPGTIISGFFPIRSEIDPRPLMDQLRQRGARLCLPVVMDKTTIVFRELVRTAELVDTGFGTRGPGPKAEITDPQMLIMPLSVFDHHGGRIGYGAGHYDRAIAKIIDKGIVPTLIGMAFDCQHHERVPVEPHDQPLNAMLTESGYREAQS